MDINDEWARLLAAAREPQTDDGRAAALDLAVALGTRVTDAAVGCSITERTGTAYRTIAAANPLSLALDEVQYAAGAGPCMAAADRGAVHRIDAMPGEERFAAFGYAALRRGVHSSLSVPLTGPAALNLYAETPAAFGSESARAVAGLLARCVSALRLGTGTADPAPGPAVLGLRDRVDRAVRSVMAERRLTRAEAFRRLARRSEDERRSLYAVVDDVLGGAAR